MQVQPFREKMTRQHQIIMKELSKFRNNWEGKLLTQQKIQTYCGLVTYVSELHASYVFNCMEYFTPAMKQETFTISRSIVQDLVKKLKQFQTSLEHQNPSLKSKQPKEMCYICASKIREVDVKLIKQQLADDASLRKSIFKKMYEDLENQNAQLFTKDEDEVFFQFLNRVLIKKEEVLAMQTKEINEFLMGVTKSFSDLNFLTEYTPVKFNPNDFRSNAQVDMEKKIMDSLKTGFNGKVHPWVSKVFGILKKYIMHQKRINSVDESQQTQQQLQVPVDYDKKRSEYAATTQSRKELQQLKQEVNKNVIIIEELKTEITVLKKQKKDLEEYYMKEVEELISEKKNVEMELKKIEKDFLNLKTLKKSQLVEINKKLGKEVRKTEPDDVSVEGNSQQRQTKKVQQNQVPSSSLPSKTQIKGQSLLQSMVPGKKRKGGLGRVIGKRADLEKHVGNQQKTTVDLVDSQQTKLNITSDAEQHDYQGGQLATEMNISTSPIKDQFLKQINSRYRKSKPKAGTQRLPLQTSQQPHHKVEFRLDHPVEHRQYNQGIDTIAEESPENRSRSEIDVGSETVGSVARVGVSKKSVVKVKNQAQVKKPVRKNQRLLSIEMKISPFAKPRQSIYKPRTQKIDSSQMNQAQNDSASGSLSTKPAIGEKKKIFQYVPLQNQQQYEQLKQKMNELTSRIQLRNSEKVRESLKVIRDESNGIDVPKFYGFTIFSKKFSDVIKEGEPSNRSKGKRRSMKDREESEEGKRNKKILSKSQSSNREKANRSKSKSFRYRLMSKKENSIEKIDSSQQTQQLNQPHSLLDNIQASQRQQLYNKLAKESLIPPSLSFHHYQMIVRKLFAEQKRPEPFEQVTNSKLLKSRVSATTNGNDQMVKRSKQKESVKINIDARFFEEVKPIKTHSSNQAVNNNNSTNNNGKMLLNLPKLAHSPSTTISTQQSNTPLNSKSNTNLIDNSKRKKSLFHTLRQSKTRIRNQSLVNVRQSFTQNVSTGLDQSCVVQEQENVVNNAQVMLSPIVESSNTSSNTNTPLNGRGSHHPSALLQPINPKVTNVFTPSDIKLLFESQLSAYQYEQMTKVAVHSHAQQANYKGESLSESDQELIRSLYSILTQIKQKNQQVYHKVCSFVKQPFQTVRSGFEFINTVKQLSLQAWTQYLVKIYSLRKGDAQRSPTNKQNQINGKYHRLSNSNQNCLSFAAFLKPFEDRLVEFLVTSSK